MRVSLWVNRSKHTTHLSREPSSVVKVRGRKKDFHCSAVITGEVRAGFSPAVLWRLLDFISVVFFFLSLCMMHMQIMIEEINMSDRMTAAII